MRLNRDIVAALNDPLVRRRLEDLNLDPHPGTPEQAAALLNSDIRRWGEVNALGFAAHEFETYPWTQNTLTRDDASAGIEGGRFVARRVHPGIWFAGPRGSEGFVLLEIDAEALF